MKLRFSVSLAVVAWVITSLLIGFIGGWSFAKAQLPSCEEDEYLYPVDDYKGPGKAMPHEYGCRLFDDTFTSVTANGQVQVCTIWDGVSQTITCTPENGKPYLVNLVTE